MWAEDFKAKGGNKLELRFLNKLGTLKSIQWKTDQQQQKIPASHMGDSAQD